MNEITVDPQEVEVWLSVKGGWHKASGFVVTIKDVKFSFVPYDQMHPKILISELSSGAKFTELNLTFRDYMLSSTKEGALSLFSEYAAKIAKVVDPEKWEQLTKMAAHQKLVHEEKFGKMPEFIPFSIDKWMEEEKWN
ncbi:hypothetical protein SDC9_94324 [bioreactor metagenome]|uniref:Uncharacterized protein n=1 Tax=bioreactor metagenome TaxID=1076179 RepID=A0A645A9U8_9ZZZZ